MMEGCILLRLYIFISVLISHIEATATNGNETTNDSRNPRVTGRIVKLYSGTRPEPITCAGEGFQADPHDCAVFYRCMKSGNGKYTVFRFQCGPGTVYDPETEVCNHPQSTKRSECGGLLPPFVDRDHANEIEGEQEIPSPISTKRLPQPEHTTTHITTSELSSQHILPEISSITTASQTGSSMNHNLMGSTSAYPFITSAVYQNPPVSVTYISTVSPSTSSSTKITSIQSKENTCINDGFMGDSENCRKFYRCVANQRGGYTRYEFSCSESTVWDDDLQGCNHAWAVKRTRCGRHNHLKKEHIDHSEHKVPDKSVQQLQISFGSKVTQISNGSVVQNQTQINYGDRISPSKISSPKQNQTQINQGSAISQSQTQIDYGNKGVQTQLKIDHSEQSSQIQAQEYVSTTQGTSSSNSPLKQMSTQQSNGCAQSGFMGDTNDCKKFYRCIHNGRGGYTRFEFSCGEGTVWDPELEACNHAWAVKECGGRAPAGSTPQATQTSTYKTTQNYHTVKPTNGYHTTLQTESNDNNEDIGYGNQNQQKITTSITTVSKTSTTETWKDENIGYGNQNQQHIPVTSTTEANVPTAALSGVRTECKTSGFMGDSNNCKKFYRCIDNGRGGYTRFEYSCGEGTVWDPELEACNHEWAVKECGGRAPAGFTPQVSQTSTYKTTQNYHTVIPTNNYHTSLQTESNGNNEDIGYGNQNQQQIIPNTTVSKTSTTESWKDDNIEYGNQNQQHTHVSSTTEVKVSTEALSGVKSICKSSGFMGDSNDCKKFYRCIDNGRGGYTRFEFSCGEGTVWDPELEACNHAWAVKECGGRAPTRSTTQVTQTSTTQNYHTAKPTEGYHTTLHTESNDNNEDIGYGNQDQQQITSSTTMSKTSTTESWNDDNIGYGNQDQQHTHVSSTTETLSGVRTECMKNGFMGDENDCKTFYRCVENGKGFTKYEFKCGEGTVWDPDIGACNHAWAVSKCGGSASTDINKVELTTLIPMALTTLIQPTTTANKPLSTDNDDHDTGYVSQNNDLNSPSPTTKQPHNLDSSSGNICKSTGFMGNENDCKRFYRCVDNGDGSFIRYEFTCGEGTVWDSDIEACNHVWAVKKCGGEGSSGINHQETITESQSSLTSDIQLSNSSSESYPNTMTTAYSTTSVTTTTLQSVSTGNNNCIRSGFMGDDKDCKKFYRCVDNGDGSFTRYDFSCGEGTVWDTKIEVCNHAWAVQKCGGNAYLTDENHASTPSYYPTISDVHHDNYPPHQGTETYTTSETITTMQSTTEGIIHSESNLCKRSGFFGDNKDCKKFYRCVDDGKGSYIRYEFSCGDGTLWDQSIEACNHVWAVKKCGKDSNHSTSTETIRPTDNGHTTSKSENQDNMQHTERTSTTESYEENEINNVICNKEGFVGDKNKCNKFYRCVDDGRGSFIKHEFTCGEGTYWNQEILSCDHATSEKPCGDKENTSTTKPPKHEHDVMDTSTSTSSSSTIAIDGSSEVITEIPQTSGVCKSEGFYGDPNDCKIFYRCVDNGKGSYTKYDFTCGDGTVWDQEIKACNHESETKCFRTSTTSTVQSSTTQSDSPGSSTSSTSTETQHSTENTETSSSTHLPGQCTSEGFFAHPHDCKKFIRCVSNSKEGYTKYEFACGEGTVWVQEILACDHDNGDSSCSDQTQSTSKPQVSEWQQQTSEESNTFTSVYIEITSTLKPETTSKLDDEYNSGSTTKPSVSGTCPSAGYYSDENDCRRFYRCVDNGQGGYTKYDYTCGEGTAWDNEIKNCNHIDQVKTCHDTSQQSSVTQSIMHEESSSSTTSSNTSSASTTRTTTTSTESSHDAGSSESCTEEGFFGNTKDCKKFYRCVDDGKGGYTKYDFTCGEGTIWDQDVTTCNHPQDVVNPSCSHQDSSSTTTTSSFSSISDGSLSTSSSTSITQSSPSYSTTQSSTESTTQGSSNCSQEEASKKPVNEGINCTKEGYYPNPNDCKKYYRCVDWDGEGSKFSVYHFECGEGTIWDPALETCNHEESVYPPRNCSGSQSQNVDHQTTSTEGTTTTIQEETTLQTSTTSQPVTDQTTQSSTSEQTTQQSTISEQTTTQQSITSEQTTTEQVTSSEQTMTEQSTTPQQTTTQQSTTSEQTTTQQSNTSEQTTSQQPTTSEQTTTQQTTTTEKTTTQQSTTSEQTTTQQSTTSEQTTQVSTTSEQTTTQSTTSEETTTQQSTTSEQTTQEPSTTEHTTQLSSTSEQSTTETTTSESSTNEETTFTTTEQSSTEQSSTEQQSTTEQTSTESLSSTTEGSSSEKECPDTDNDQYLFVCPTSFRRHPKYCNMFYQCTEDDSNDMKIATFTCPNNTIYDESQTKCVEESKADKKCEGEIAQRRRFKRLDSDYREPIVASRQSYTCPNTGYFTFEKDSECSPAFLKCKIDKSKKLRGYVYQCPTGYYFWAISRKCEPINKIKDCKRSSNNWSGRWEIPVERTNVASS